MSDEYNPIPQGSERKPCPTCNGAGYVSADHPLLAQNAPAAAAPADLDPAHSPMQQAEDTRELQVMDEELQRMRAESGAAVGAGATQADAEKRQLASEIVAEKQDVLSQEAGQQPGTVQDVAVTEARESATPATSWGQPPAASQAPADQATAPGASGADQSGAAPQTAPSPE